LEQNHVLSFTGGNDDGTYYLSFGYSDQQGMVQKLSDTKYSGRINADYNIKPWLKVGTNTSFIRSNSEIFDDDGVFDRARGANPMLPISNVLVLNYGDFYDQNYFNPLNTLKIDNDRIRNRIITSNFLNINPYKGINLRTSFSLNSYEESRFKYVPNDIQEAIRYAHFGENTHVRDKRVMWQWDNSLTYDNTFGKNRINALIGTSTSKIDRNYTQVIGRGYDTNIFSYYNLGASYQTGNRSIGSDFTSSSLVGFLARANYTYADKYYLTATARYDGSSKFAKGYKWGLFPSFSGAWNVTGEDFMQKQNIFDQLKVRLGYGSVGNQEIGDYAFLTLYSPNITEGETTYVAGDRMGTNNISWESQQQLNFGIDMSVLSNRIRLSMDVFKITNNDLLMTRNVNPSSGFKTAVVNVGSIENKGGEFTVDVNAIKAKDFEWNISANISADRNKVTKLYGGNEYILNYDADRNLQKEGNLFIGQPRNTIYIWKTGGIAQTEDMENLNKINWSGRIVNPGDLYPLDVAGLNSNEPDGKIDDNDRVIVGSTDPKFYGGFSTEFIWKGISLNAIFNYSYGAKKLSYLYETMIGSNGRSLASIDLLDRWTPENTDAKFPRPMLDDPSDSYSYNTFSASQMDFSVQNASYLRLSTLTVAYTLPKKIINKMKFDSIRIYTTASNVFCLTSYKGYDPETGDWYPPTRMFVAGLNVSL
jgi:TonB-linked SusC/RagA family outer membrane protein